MRSSGPVSWATSARRPRPGHGQSADPPGRHQPGTGELNFATILRALDDGGYEGHVGLEDKPLGSNRETLPSGTGMGLTLGGGGRAAPGESLLWVTAMGYPFG